MPSTLNFIAFENSRNEFFYIIHVCHNHINGIILCSRCVGEDIKGIEMVIKIDNKNVIKPNENFNYLLILNDLCMRLIRIERNTSATSATIRPVMSRPSKTYETKA